MHPAANITRAMAEGDVVTGTWLTIPHPMVVETMALGGADFLLIDGEHGPVPPDALATLLPPADRLRMPVVYRVRANREELIKPALDAGAAGVMVPMVNSPDDARAAVAAARYAPLGRRGIGPWRASGYYTATADYLITANDRLSVTLQIETPQAVAAVADIAAVPGFNTLFVGPADLAASMGLPIGVAHPGLMEACRTVAATARAAGKAAGIDIAGLDMVRPFREMGFTVFTYGMDAAALIDGTRAAMADLRYAATPPDPV